MADETAVLEVLAFVSIGVVVLCAIAFLTVMWFLLGHPGDADDEEAA